MMRIPFVLFIAATCVCVLQVAAATHNNPNLPAGCGPHGRRSQHATPPFNTIYDVTLFYYTPGDDEAHHSSGSPTLIHTADMENITMVSHVTVDRLPHVRRWCRSFRGPMSISVFVRPYMDDIRTVMEAFIGDLCIGKHAVLHLVTELGHWYDGGIEDVDPRSGLRIKYTAKPKDMMVHYPSNVQRNAALDGCTGALAFLLDIDFHLQPASRANEEALRKQLTIMRERAMALPFLSAAEVPWMRHTTVFVVPAVETVSKEVKIPETLADLRKNVEGHRVCEFYGHYCKPCHHPTKLRHFLSLAVDDENSTTTATTAITSKDSTAGESTTLDDYHNNVSTEEAEHHGEDDVAPYFIEYEEQFEPYVIVNRTSITKQRFPFPRYNESFLGRFWDKSSFFYEVAGQKRPFAVLPGYYLVHHGRGDDVQWPKKPSLEYKRREHTNLEMLDEFMRLVQRKYRRRWRLVVTNNGSTVPQPPLEQDEETERWMQTLVVEDATLVRSTKNIDWATISSNGRGWSSSGLGPDETTVTRALTCIAAHREALLALLALPKQDWTQSAEHYEARGYLKGLESALQWLCGQMDCSPLLLASQPTERDGMRAYPRSIVAQADWAFQRWLQSTPSRKGIITYACNFNGAAKFAEGVEGRRHVSTGGCASSQDDGQDGCINATLEREGGDEDDVVQQEHKAIQKLFLPSGGETERATVVGCTLNPHFPITQTKLQELIETICSDPEESPKHVEIGEENAEQPFLMLGSYKAKKLRHAAVADRIGGGCSALFERIDPLVADNLYVKASVALNAHHLIYFAGGEGRTCRMRFGGIAAYLRMNESSIETS